MPTLLANRKMDPALAARVASSVLGRPVEAHGIVWGRRAVFYGRLLFLLVVAGAVIALVVLRRRAATELRRTRSEVLAEVRAGASSLDPEGATLVSRAESWAQRLAGPYEGDVVDIRLQDPPALDTLLHRPALYVRAARVSFASATTRGVALRSSHEDALILCLTMPPSGRGEAAMLARVRVPEVDPRRRPLETHDEREAREVARLVPNVRDVALAERGLPFVLPTFEAEVAEAREVGDLLRLRDAYRAAKVPEALEALRSTLLVVAVDEPRDEGAPTELDGETPHLVRLSIVDLPASRLLLRLRRHVDPGWISPAERPEHAASLDSCLLAMDARDRMLEGTRKPAP